MVLVRAAIAALVAVGCGSAHAFTFTIGTVEGSFDSTISAGVGIRTASPSSNLVSPTYNVATGAQTGGGRLGQLSGLSDQGDINYGKGDPFTSYLKGNHELVLKMPSRHVHGAGHLAVRLLRHPHDRCDQRTGPVLQPIAQPERRARPMPRRTSASSRACSTRVSKQFNVGDQIARVRVGNQVVSWGESIWEVGGSMRRTRST